MSKQNDPRLVLVNKLLPMSLSKIEALYDLPIVEEVDDKRRPGQKVKRVNMRLVSLQSKVAMGVVGAVIKLEDQSLKRKAGSKLDDLLKAIKQARPEIFGAQYKAIEGKAESLPSPDTH